MYISALKEDLSRGRIRRLYWLNTLAMVADGLTTGSVPRDALLRLCNEGLWNVTGRSECVIGQRTWETVPGILYASLP